MMYEQWAAGRNPDYRPTLVDLWQLAAERTAERDRNPVIVVSRHV